MKLPRFLRRAESYADSLADRDFHALASYNAEVSRGIVHTPEWDARMADLQRAYDSRLDGMFPRLGPYVIVPNGDGEG